MLFCPTSTNPHKCYVEYPIVPPPQGCLVVKNQGGDAEIWSYALIVFPEDAELHEEINDATYCAAIGIINAKFRAVMNKDFAEAMSPLWEKTWEEYPFRDESKQSITPDIRKTLADVSDAKLSVQDLAEKITAVLVSC